MPGVPAVYYGSEWGIQGDKMCIRDRYKPVRYIIEPWIQFIRNIPPLAYVPLVVISAGVGRRPQVIVIWLATFLIMTVTIYQGVRNVDETLIKAARVLGAKDKDIFVKVVFPATTPFILTAVRLGVSVAVSYTHLDVYKRQAWRCSAKARPEPCARAH